MGRWQADRSPYHIHLRRSPAPVGRSGIYSGTRPADHPCMTISIRKGGTASCPLPFTKTTCSSFAHTKMPPVFPPVFIKFDTLQRLGILHNLHFVHLSFSTKKSITRPIRVDFPVTYWYSIDNHDADCGHLCICTQLHGIITERRSFSWDFSRNCSVNR